MTEPGLDAFSLNLKINNLLETVELLVRAVELREAEIADLKRTNSEIIKYIGYDGRYSQ
jgi:hypothetical protein